MNATDPRVQHLDDALCADLVLGLADADTRAAALAHATECAACEARLRDHVRAHERAWSDAPDRVRAPIALASRRHARAWLFAAAAVLAAVVATPRFLAHGDRATNALLLPAPGAEVRTREGGEEDPRLAAGLAAYAAHDLVTAERELSAAHASGSGETLRRLYLAQVRLARGRAREATALLRGIDWRTVPEPWRHDGVALLAHALRATGADASADSIEQALRTHDPSTPIVP